MTTKNKTKKVEEKVIKIAEETLGGVQEVVDVTGRKIEQTMAPIRENIIKRFPILFMLLTTFGFIATVTGMEQILIQFDILQTHPGAILSIGIGTLIFTGTLYKKLG